MEGGGEQDDSEEGEMEEVAAGGSSNLGLNPPKEARVEHDAQWREGGSEVVDARRGSQRAN